MLQYIAFLIADLFALLQCVMFHCVLLQCVAFQWSYFSVPYSCLPFPTACAGHIPVCHVSLCHIPMCRVSVSSFSVPCFSVSCFSVSCFGVSCFSVSYFSVLPSRCWYFVSLSCYVLVLCLVVLFSLHFVLVFIAWGMWQRIWFSGVPVFISVTSIIIVLRHQTKTLYIK